MSTKYFCDVCQGEKQAQQLSSVEVQKPKESMPHHFDVCGECSEKMFEPVKRWDWGMIVEIKDGRP